MDIYIIHFASDWVEMMVFAPLLGLYRQATLRRISEYTKPCGAHSYTTVPLQRQSVTRPSQQPVHREVTCCTHTNKRAREHIFHSNAGGPANELPQIMPRKYNPKSAQASEAGEAGQEREQGHRGCEELRPMPSRTDTSFPFRAVDFPTSTWFYA